MNHLGLTFEPLDIKTITERVSAASCGAISIFVGTTRDTFDGKTVQRLEYEAYEPMAIKTMEEICDEIRRRWTAVEHIAIYHRLGTVPVKEASVVIAIGSPHRSDAIRATEWCIDSVKKLVPVWKKEVYAGDVGVWKENKEFVPPKRETNEQRVEIPFVPSHLVQIKASAEEIDRRVDKFVRRKRDEIDERNVRDFCTGRDPDADNSCARVDAALLKRKDSKGHLKVNRVLNTYKRDRTSSEYLMRMGPKSGIEERLANLQSQLCMDKAVPKDVYATLRELEERLLHLETLSLEYVQFWGKTRHARPRKKVFSVDEIDSLIAKLRNETRNDDDS